VSLDNWKQIQDTKRTKKKRKKNKDETYFNLEEGRRDKRGKE